MSKARLGSPPATVRTHPTTDGSPAIGSGGLTKSAQWSSPLPVKLHAPRNGSSKPSHEIHGLASEAMKVLPISGVQMAQMYVGLSPSHDRR
jgi:hypothetical protein